jgi:hypothetical protein
MAWGQKKEALRRHSSSDCHCLPRCMKDFLISIFHLVLNVVCFLLGNSPASEFYISTFRNPLSVPSSQAGRYEE